MQIYLQFSSGDNEFCVSKMNDSIVSFIIQTMDGAESLSMELGKDELELLQEWIEKQLEIIT